MRGQNTLRYKVSIFEFFEPYNLDENYSAT